ncbi:NAD(P)H-dependent oxidoreductase [Williamsia sp. CHRR-6]|uniref:NAD(P)H-dependent oxidoreductase n=1 Tax=Williamsia sp. CHRR-6 TaxID=2835871 RepID=UPI001BD98EB0|nr:NAD(P)H-dependent oxidoreductase [Williamsia sp. CHRR-6]MBT0565498.1 NAD(P)H-dependent oxidoreductase [Williamsia sp. CHRR-6]
MSDTTTVAVLVGSLRKDSINAELAQLAASVAPESTTVSVIEGLHELPFYSEELDIEPGDSQVKSVRAQLDAADAVLIVTPEYNGTIPATIKNIIDWASRPYGAGALKDKPAAVIGAALGQYGGKWSQDDARRSLGVAGSRVVEGIEFGLPISSLDGRPVAEVPEVVDSVRGVVADLVAATKQ